MERIDHLKARLPKIPDVVTCLKKESENSLCGPCPKCGGEDRFVYKTDSEKFWCRQCRPETSKKEPPGDIIDFHKWLYGLTTGDLFSQYFPKDEQDQKDPGKKESPAELWASIIQKYTNDNPVYRLFSNLRKINKNTASQVFAQGKVRFFKHRGKESVACAFRELDGDQNVLAVQCLTLDGQAFAYKDENKVFTKGSQASGSCFFHVGTDIEKVETIILCEAVIDALSCVECLPEACILAIGGSSLTKKVKVLRPYRDSGKQIVCFFDNDDAGTKATQSVAKILGVKTQSVEWPKDAPEKQDINDLLKAGEHKTIIEMVNNAKLVKIESSPINGEDNNAPQVISINAKDFLALKLPPRENLLAPWLPTQGLTMLHAKRGVGKTHVALGIALAVASGGKFLRWNAPEARGVLFVDGEMPAVVLQERIASIVSRMDGEIKAPLLIITPDLQKNGVPDLASVEGQLATDKHIDSTIQLIILDNISTLVRSGRENTAEDWQPVQNWALRLRAKGKSVLLIHHDNKSGGQRGTAKKEDVLDTVLSLQHPPGYSPEAGARFEVHFEKARGIFGEDVAPFEASLQTGEKGDAQWALRTLEESTYSKVVELVKKGRTPKEITDFLNIHKSSVSRHIKKAQEDGDLQKK